MFVDDGRWRPHIPTRPLDLGCEGQPSAQQNHHLPSRAGQTSDSRFRRTYRYREKRQCQRTLIPPIVSMQALLNLASIFRGFEVSA